MRVNGQRAIGIGISTDPEKDVVRTGRLIEQKLATITPMMPLGIALQTLYPENRIAAEANRAFVVNLLESVAIVILLIMAIMGFRPADRQLAAFHYRRHAADHARAGCRAEPDFAGRVHHCDGHARR